jgi:hypothetical protein
MHRNFDLLRATDDAKRFAEAIAMVEEGLREEARSAIFQKPPAVPPDQPTLDARMARHRWAADRLWAWNGGLDVRR